MKSRWLRRGLLKASAFDIGISTGKTGTWMKRFFVVAIALADCVSTVFGGIGVEWSNGGSWMVAYGGNVDEGPGIAENNEVVWQLIYAGPNDEADGIDLSAPGYVGGDDMVLAERVIPQGGGTASDGTKWDVWLEWEGGYSCYEDLSWTEKGYVFQRIYQGTPSTKTYYFESELFWLDTSYGLASVPQDFPYDFDGNGVCVDRSTPGGILSIELELDASGRVFPAQAAGENTLAVMANVPWAAESSSPWLIVKTENGTGNGTIVYDVAENTATNTRTGTISVTGEELVRTFTVTQGGAAPRLELGADERTFTANAANGVELAVAANLSWTAESSALWLTVTTGGGTGNGHVVYDVTENTVTNERTGTITVTGGGLVRTFTVEQGGAAPRLELGADERTFTADAASGLGLAVLANVPWRAESSVSWLTVEEGSGTGNGNVVYAVAENTATQARTGTITVYGGGVSLAFTVTQNGAAPRLELGADERTFTANAVSGMELAVMANVPWTAESSASWLTVTTGSGKGDGNVVYDVAENTATNARTGTITVSGDGRLRMFTVTQGGAASWLELEADERTFTANAASGLGLAVTANVSWRAESSASWLTVTTGGGTWNGNVVYDVAENTATNARTGTITVSGGGLVRTFTVTQGGAAPRLELGAQEGTCTSDAVSRMELVLTANVPWTAESSVSWLTVTTGSGTGSGNVVYSVGENTATNARTGTIVVTGGGLVRTFTVTQGGAAATTGPVGIGVRWSNGDSWLVAWGGDIDEGPGVAENNEVVWQLIYAGANDEADEIDLSAPGYVGGDDVVLAERVIPQGGGEAADGTSWDEWLCQLGGDPCYEDLAWTDEGHVFQRIYQGVPSAEIASYYFESELFLLDTSYQPERKPQVFSYDSGGNGVCVDRTTAPTVLVLNASERDFPSEGASGMELAVTANVPWTAESSASWLTVTMGCGTGNGTIVYDMAANMWTNERTGNITVAGGGKSLTFTVTQMGHMLAEIKNVTAKYAWPWGVYINYEVSQAIPSNALLMVTATDQAQNMTYTAVANALSGDMDHNAGAHRLIWDMDKQGLKIGSTNVVFTVEYLQMYCVVDLSGGANVSSYPVAYMDAPPNGGFNTDEYKTTKLVMRRIEPGTFMMGGSTQTTLSKPYYVGLFEVTQKQYQLVTGSWPSRFSGDMRPVEYVSWNTIRGNSAWPASTAVSTDSFIGRIRARTGLGDFDLPTEAQWEYACQSGRTTTYSYGNNADGGYMWYSSNSSRQTRDVGTKQPNPWDIYDMHGNVWEWCLDWYGTLSGGSDPTGSFSGENRVLRGGSWYDDSSSCTSFHRYSRTPSSAYNNIGFRLVRTLSE